MNRTVILTRPEGDNARLQATLETRGYRCVVQPLLRIVPLPEAELPDPPNLVAGDLCIFISANAARMGLPTLMGPMVEQSVMSFAVGPRTASVLEVEGLAVTVPQQMDSEGLLALPELTHVQDKHIVIVKGEGGRETLTETLESRGARVEEYICYRREAALIDRDNFSDMMNESEALVFQANSIQTLDTLSDLIAGKTSPSIFEQPIVVPSQRVADRASERGWLRVVCAADAGDEAFLAALESFDADGFVAPQPSLDAANIASEQDTPDTQAMVDGVPSLAVTQAAHYGSGKKSDAFARTVLLMLLLVIAGGGTAAYVLLWPQWVEQQRTLTQLSRALAAAENHQQAFQATVADRVANLSDEMAERAASQLQDQLRQQAVERADFSEQQRRFLQRLDRLDIRIARLTATDRREWLANEAAFLVRLAAERLLSARDVSAASALLANADALLAEANDPRFESARAALAQDRVALRASPVVDVVGLYARFSALAGQAAALNVVPELGPALPTAADSGTQDWKSRAQAGWEMALAKLSSYLVVRRRDAEMSRIMTPDWEVLVRQNLRMLIEQAQIAALSHNPILYASALNRAVVFVAEFAELDPVRSAAITNELTALSALNIAPELPDLVASRAALADALKRFDGGEMPKDTTSAPLSEDLEASEAASLDVQVREAASSPAVSTEG